MGTIFERIDPKLRRWIGEQALFFVGTAPLSERGRVNVSPKGPIGSLRVLDEHTVAWLDVVGSGAETIAHLRENGRIVVMLCAFSGPPKIVRLHGRGRVVLPGTREFGALLRRARFVDLGIPESRRAIVVVDVERIADSCGYGVPQLRFVKDRDTMARLCKHKLAVEGPATFTTYVAKKNATSIDGLPALDVVVPSPSKGATPMAKGIERGKKQNKPKLSTKEKQKKKKEKQAAKGS